MSAITVAVIQITTLSDIYCSRRNIICCLSDDFQIIVEGLSNPYLLIKLRLILSDINICEITVSNIILA